MKSVIITSTGRTGTYFLFRLLSENCQNCNVYHNSRYTAFLNVLSNAYLAGWVAEPLLRGVWSLLKESEVYEESNNTYIDSNNHLYAMVSIAPDLYPNLSVVHVVRDPRDYVRSHVNWAYSRNKSYLANFLLPFWQPNGYLVNEISFKRWKSIDWFERFCWIWDFKNRCISNVNNENICYKLFHAEDFFNQKMDIYRELSEFINIDVKPGISISENNHVNQSRSAKIPHWKMWTDQKCAILDRWCGRLMQDYGYGLEDIWINKVESGRAELEEECLVP